MKNNKVCYKLCGYMGMLVFAMGLMVGPLEGRGSGIDDQALKEYLAKIGGTGQGELKPVKSKTLDAVFEGVAFYSLNFRRYPVAVKPPEPLALNNVFAVSNGKVKLLKTEKELDKFFKESISSAKTVEVKRMVVESWLMLDQALQRDGYFEFQKPVVKANNDAVSGELQVVDQRRDKGKLTVVCQFEDSGKLRTIKFKSSLYRGIRPR